MPVASLSTGTKLYYEVHGEGEPLLLLMGTSADHSYWGYQIPAYARRYRTIVFDSPGTGQSSTPEEPATCTMGALAEEVKALLDHLGVARAHVAGLSLGSTVAQELALRYPDRVATLALHGTWGRPDPWFVYAIESMKYPLLLDDYPGFVRTAFAWILTAEWVNDAARGKPMLQAVLDNPHPPRVKGILGHLHADVLHDAWERLPRIACPTLVTAGERDLLVPPRLGQAVADRIPGALYHLWRGAGSSHLACAERSEEWNDLTLEWTGRYAV